MKFRKKRIQKINCFFSDFWVYLFFFSKFLSIRRVGSLGLVYALGHSSFFKKYERKILEFLHFAFSWIFLHIGRFSDRWQSNSMKFRKKRIQKISCFFSEFWIYLFFFRNFFQSGDSAPLGWRMSWATRLFSKSMKGKFLHFCIFHFLEFFCILAVFQRDGRVIQWNSEKKEFRKLPVFFWNFFELGESAALGWRMPWATRLFSKSMKGKFLNFWREVEKVISIISIQV